jgi:hypothetical protein
MKRIENTIQYTNGTGSNNQNQSAFYTVGNNNRGGGLQMSNNNNNSLSFTWLINTLKSIDWKTVCVAVLWPFVIRIIFFVLRRIRYIL